MNHQEHAANVRSALPDVAVFLDPSSVHLERDRLFDVSENNFTGDRILAPYAYAQEWFRARGIPVHTADRLVRNEVRGRMNVYLSLGLRTRWRSLARRPDVVLAALFALECPIVNPKLYEHLAEAATAFQRVYSFSDGASLSRFLTAPVTLHQFRIPQSFDTVHSEHWNREDRAFLTMISANKKALPDADELYTERLRAIEFFGRSKEIDLYGVGWDVPTYRVVETRVPAGIRRTRRAALNLLSTIRRDPMLEAARLAWRGSVKNKAETLAGYDFAICFENMRLRGYITEKIFDCFFAGTIPVYLGDPDIANVIPNESFVDMRRFENYEQLAQYLHGMGRPERCAMRAAGRDFVSSEGFRPFSQQTFAEMLGDVVSMAAPVQVR